jgi:hypothetical protein
VLNSSRIVFFQVALYKKAGALLEGCVADIQQEELNTYDQQVAAAEVYLELQECYVRYV